MYSFTWSIDNFNQLLMNNNENTKNTKTTYCYCVFGDLYINYWYLCLQPIEHDNQTFISATVKLLTNESVVAKLKITLLHSGEQQESISKGVVSIFFLCVYFYVSMHYNIIN